MGFSLSTKGTRKPHPPTGEGSHLAEGYRYVFVCQRDEHEGSLGRLVWLRNSPWSSGDLHRQKLGRLIQLLNSRPCGASWWPSGHGSPWLWPACWKGLHEELLAGCLKTALAFKHDWAIQIPKVSRPETSWWGCHWKSRCAGHKFVLSDHGLGTTFRGCRARQSTTAWAGLVLIKLHPPRHAGGWAQRRGDYQGRQDLLQPHGRRHPVSFSDCFSLHSCSLDGVGRTDGDPSSRQEGMWAVAGQAGAALLHSR